MAFYSAQAALQSWQAVVKPVTAFPCGSALAYPACCGRYHARLDVPRDAEVLMRSRYRAYVYHLENYLRATWHPDTCPAELHSDGTPQPQWLGLEIRAHRVIDAQHATVEFIARYKINGRAYRLHEVSRFTRVDGVWCYLDGEHPS